MTDAQTRFGHRALTLAVVGLTVLWTVAAGLAPLAANAQVSLSANSLIRGTSFSTVYYYGADGMRYTFPNEKTYMTWYSDFSNVVTISDAQLASIALGGNVVYRPGSYWVKIQSDPKVYAVSADGALHWIESEAVASALYGGSGWNTFIHDVPDTFFADYTVGASLMSASSLYDGALASMNGNTYLITGGQRRMVSSAGMAANRLMSKFVLHPTVDFSSVAAGSDITGYVASVADTAQKATDSSSPAASGSLSIALASDTPAGATLPGGANGVEVVKVRVMAGAEAATLNSLVVNMGGIGATSNVANAYLYEGTNRLTEARSVNSSTRQATFSNLNLAFAAGQTRNISVVVETSSSQTAADTFNMGIASASMVGASGTVSGSFPVTGNTFTMASQDVGTVTIAKSGTISNPSLGAQGATIGQFTIAAASEDASVSRLRLKIDNAADHTGYALYQGSTKLADGVWASGDFVDFTLATAYTILDGNTKIFTVKANIGGQSADTVKVFLDKATDLIARGGDYGFNMAVTRTDYDGDSCTSASGDCSYSTVQGGKVTFAFNGPAAADIARNSQDQVLLAFSVSAAQEVTIKDLDVQVYGDDDGDGDAFDRISESDTDNDNDGLINSSEANLKDIKIRNASTKVTVMGPLELDDVSDSNGNGTGTIGATGATSEDATQLIDFTDDVTLAAGSTQNWEVTADIDDGAATGTAFGALLYTAGLSIEDNNGDALTLSTDVVPTGNIQGNNQTARAASLTVALASAPTSFTTVQGSSNVNVGSFTFTAGTASPVAISSIKVSAYAADSGNTMTAGGGSGFQVEDMVSSCSIYNMAGTLLDGPNGAESSGTYFLFDNVSWTIPAGAVEKLVVKCNIANTADTDSDTLSVDLADLSADIVAVDADSNTVTPTTDAPNGGTTATVLVTVAASGSLAVAADAASPDAGIVLTGSSNNLVSKFRFTATNEDFTVTTMTFSEEQAEDDTSSADSSAYANNIGLVRISYPNASNVTQTATAAMSGNEATFSGLSFFVPANSPKVVDVSVDVPGTDRDSGGSAASGEKIRMGFSNGDGSGSDDFRAVGAGSGDVLDESDVSDVGDSLESSSGIATFVVRETKPTVSLASGSPSGAKIPGLDEVLRFTVAAASNEDVVLSEMVFQLSTTDNNGEGSTDDQPDWNECETDQDGSTNNINSAGADFAFYDYSDLATPLDGASDWTMLSSALAACTSTQADVRFVHLQLATKVKISAGTTKTFSLWFDSTGASAANDDSLRVDIPADPIVAIASFLDSGSVDVDGAIAQTAYTAADTIVTDANSSRPAHGDIVCITTGTCASSEELVLVSNKGATNTNLYVVRGYMGTNGAAIVDNDQLDYAPSSFVWFDDGSTTSTDTEEEDEVAGAYSVKNLPIIGGNIVF
jgi:hypothetical protein